MKKYETGFSAVVVVIIILAIGITGFAGWSVWRANSSKTAGTKTESSEVPAKNPPAQRDNPATPIFNPLPSAWTEYKDDTKGLRIGYPTVWGNLDSATLQTPDYQDDTKNLQGRLTVAISKKEGFSVVARKYGATIQPSANAKSWLVSEENPANVDGYKVGDTYKTIERKVSSGVAIDLTFTDEECTHTRYLLTLKNAYAVVSIPELCPVNFEPVPAANKQAYTQLVTSFLNTITLY